MCSTALANGCMRCLHSLDLSQSSIALGTGSVRRSSLVRATPDAHTERNDETTLRVGYRRCWAMLSNGVSLANKASAMQACGHAYEAAPRRRPRKGLDF